MDDGFERATPEILNGGFPLCALQNLKREQIRAKDEITRIQSVPLVIGQFSEMVDENYGIVGSTAGSNYYGSRPNPTPLHL